MSVAYHQASHQLPYMQASSQIPCLKDNKRFISTSTDTGETVYHNGEGSPVHLEKTLMNLVSNAVEAISDRGSVMIRTENRYLDKPIRGYDDVREGDYVVLTVSDTGKGISAMEIEKIFEPFY